MLNKKLKVVVMAPYPSVSGYGAHSRDIITSLIKMNKYDLTLIPLNWGQCPQNALTDDNEFHRKMFEYTIKEPMTSQPDIFIHITIPNEFKQIGKKNIGITAGIETDRVSPNWVEMCNKMDLVIFPSYHSLNSQKNSVYQYKDNNNNVVGSLKTETDLKVLFEGIDEEIYKELDDTHIITVKHPLHELTTIPEEFCFLSVGQWQLKGHFRDSRKDIGGTIYNFIKTFHYQKDKVGLILKVNGAGFSLLDKKEILHRIKEIREMLPDIDKQPNIYLVHGHLSDSEMNELYNLNKVKAMFSTTHGEGYGRPFAEFLGATGKPTYVTGWSGHTDFITNKDFQFDYELKDIPGSMVWDNILVEGSKWAIVVDSDVQNKLNHCYHNYNDVFEKSKLLSKTLKEKKNLDTMAKELENILEDIKPPVQQNIILPGSIDISKLRKISEG